jgi:hypothetical protein
MNIKLIDSLLSILINIDKSEVLLKKMYRSYKCYDNMGSVFDDSANHQITRDVVKTALSQDGTLLSRGVDKPDYKLCKIAVSQNGMAMRSCPKRLIDYDLCKIAVTSHPFALSYCLTNKIDYKLCEIAVSQNGLALRYCPCKVIDYKLCELAVLQNGLALEYCPENKIDHNLCESSVTQNGLALQHCPKDEINYKLCELAVSQNPLAIQYCTRIFTNDKQDLISLAINKVPKALNYIDESHTKLERYARYIASKLGISYHRKDLAETRYEHDVPPQYFPGDYCSKHRFVKEGQIITHMYYYCTKDSCKRTRMELYKKV